MIYYTKAGIHSRISSTAITDCVASDTYYPVQGTFDRHSHGGFDINGGITYIGQDKSFALNVTGTAQTNTTNTVITFGFFLNDVLVEASTSIIELDKTSDINAFTVLAVLHAKTDDVFSVKLKSNKIAEITVKSFSAIIQEF